MTNNRIVQIHERLAMLSNWMDTTSNCHSIRKRGLFSYVSLGTGYLNQLLKIGRDLKKQGFKNFCDLGSGPGNIGFIFELIGYKTFGVEISQYYCNMAHGNIIQGDLCSQSTLGRLRKSLPDTKTLFYSYTPIVPDLRGSKVNGKETMFLKNLENIMRKDDVFVYFIIGGGQIDIIKRIFKTEKDITTGKNPFILKKR